MDHYSTLGVAKNATPDEIKKAYRKLASQHHPDKGGDTATFQKLQSAYDTLADPTKRQQYDNPMPQGFNHGTPQGFGPGGIPPGFEHIFGQMFGGANPFDPFGNQRHQRPQSQVLRTVLNITLEQAFLGEEMAVKLQTPTNTHAVKINVPKGVQNGTQLRIDNAIDSTSLLVEFRIAPHLKFDRQGNDLVSNQSISVLDLIVGTNFEFTTLSGKVLSVTVKPKTQPYMQLKLSGQGMPILNTNAYGDQIILIKPFIPDTIDEEIANVILKHTKGNT
jgi:DnaJ-class molecular chaperone